MKIKKILLYTSVSIPILFILAAVVFYIQYPELFNCLTIGESDEFIELNRNIYISKDTPEAVRDSITSILKEADDRVCTFWNMNKKTKDPVIIFCYNKSLLSLYSKNNLIITYKTPLNSYIIFYKDRINLDMLSHEISHAEFCARTGYFNNKNIPTWFDEGLAMQVDYRTEYSAEQYFKLKDSLGISINPPEISSPEKFYSGNNYYHFLAAGYEVNSWINIVKNEGVHELIRRIKDGEQFYFVYEELKAKAGE